MLTSLCGIYSIVDVTIALVINSLHHIYLNLIHSQIQCTLISIGQTEAVIVHYSQNIYPLPEYNKQL
jgi:uncharacterized integral membrane protein